MDAIAALARVRHVQSAFRVIAALMITAYLFPKQAVVNDHQEFDFIVVGAGSAGAVVAARLAECRYSVLLVEAGGDPTQEALIPSLFLYSTLSQHDWNYTSENDNYTFQCHRSKTGQLTLGRVLGGGSSLNYMYYVRGCPGDFDPWAEASQDPAWTWKRVLPYFIKSERLQDPEIIHSPMRIFHGTKGFLGVTRPTSALADKYLESFKQLGHDIILDINSDRHLGYNQPMFTISNGVRQSTAYTILRAMKDKKNLHVLKNTHVNRILFDKNKNAIGIEVTTNDNKHITLNARMEVIVSAGAINGPRLLMLSGIGPKNHLQSLNIPVISDVPVGENLQDHLAIMINIKLEKNSDRLTAPDPRQYPVDAFTGYVALNKSNICPDYQTVNNIVHSDSPSALQFCVHNCGFDFDICQDIYEAGKGRRTLLTLLNVLHPKSRGRVLLRSKNPADPPLVNNWWLSDDRDVETIIDSAMDFVKVLNTSYFRSIGAEMVSFKSVPCTMFESYSRDWWRCYIKCMMIPFQHYVGSCALGFVVDSHLRVFGVNRLRIVDGSIMTELVSGNTNAASIMIGEKGADLIKQDHCCNSHHSEFLTPPPVDRWANWLY